MYLRKDPTFRFWVTVYAFPAMIPLLLNVAFGFLVQPAITDAFGAKGSIICSRISIGLSGSFIVLVILANIMAFWHQSRKLPAIPGAPTPATDSN